MNTKRWLAKIEFIDKWFIFILYRDWDGKKILKNDKKWINKLDYKYYEYSKVLLKSSVQSENITYLKFLPLKYEL